MTLRRTGLARKAELRRTPMPRRRRELKARVARKIARSKSTGPTPAQRNLVLERAAGCCELCGVVLHHGLTGWLADHSFHHRQPRGMGGTTTAVANSPANLLLVCGTGTTGCHGAIEQNRDIAYANGWLVRRPTDPATLPVIVHAYDTTPVLLTTDGAYEEAAA